MKRRDFLQTTGAVIVGFVMDLTLGELAMAQDGSLPAPGKPVDPKQVGSFIAIHPDGSVSIYTSKVDVGTGLRIAISQMVAEELGVPVEKITVVEGDTAITPDHGGTGGSTGIPRGGTDLRQAAATARQAIDKLRAEKPGASLGELIGGKQLMLQVDPKAPLKNPSQYTVVGKPILRTDVPAKTTGRFTYVQDFSVPGMLHARVIRPKSFGSKLMAVDEASIRNIPNARVVRIGNFLAVVANDEWAAVRASRELKMTWSDWRGLPGSDRLEQYVRNGAVDKDEAIINKGDAPAALSTGTKQLQASYFWPYQSHASLGPGCAVADVRPEGTTIW